ncbi:MAG TPA: NUDIX domain-containing protein [Ktedonobacterales bacterium]
MGGKKRSAPSRYRIACSAIIERGGEYLMARRRDIGWWNLPGGGLEAGETVEQGLAREVREEVGIEVRIMRLVGVYSKPQKSEVVLTFLCKPADETLPTTSEEVSEVRWFTADALPEDTLPKHRQRVLDAALGQPEAILRAQTTSTEEDQRLNRE